MELYIKYPTDPNYDPVQVQTNGEIEMLITQIQTILFTNNGEVMGDSGLGCDLEKLIYEFGSGGHDIKATILEQLNTYCPLASKYHVDVKVDFMKGSVRDIAFIDITIDSRYSIKINML